MDTFLDFTAQMLGGRGIEIVAVLCGLANIVLIVRRSIWNYPFGLVMVTLYAVIFFDNKLYSDASLQLYFFAMQVYGLWNWLHGRADDGRVVVLRLPPRQAPLFLFGGLAAIAALGGAMAAYTDAAFPHWDGAIAILSVTAQYFMARRYLEHWILWIVVDLLAIALFLLKGLYPTAALYSVFLVLSGTGLLSWWRIHRAEPAPSAAVAEE